MRESRLGRLKRLGTLLGVTWLGNAACSDSSDPAPASGGSTSNDTSGSGGSSGSAADPGPGSSYTPPPGVPADFCTGFARCCYISQSAEICDPILSGYYEARNILPAEQLAQACAATCDLGACNSADELTLESLQAAKQSLASGSSSAQLSSLGCQSYEQTVTNGVITAARVSSGQGSDSAVFEASYGATELHMTTTLGGQITWTANATANAAGELSALVVEQNAPGTARLVRRDTYTPVDADTLHVVHEISSLGADLAASGEYDVPEAMPAFGGAPGVEVRTEGCTAEQDAELKSTLESVILEGFRCLRDKGRPDLGTFLLSTYFGNSITLSCANRGTGALAQLAILGKFTSYLFGSFNVEVNVDRLFAEDGAGNRTVSPEQAKNVLLHELLHLRFGPHQPSLGGPRQFEIDRTYACAATCFEANPATRTKCACASCLQTDICDERCSEFAECDGLMGASCNGLPPQWFATATECAMSCSAPCKVHDVSCGACN